MFDGMTLLLEYFWQKKATTKVKKGQKVPKTKKTWNFIINIFWREVKHKERDQYNIYFEKKERKKVINLIYHFTESEFVLIADTQNGQMMIA